MSSKQKTFKVEIPTQKGEFISLALRAWIGDRGKAREDIAIGGSVKFTWRGHTDSFSPSQLSRWIGVTATERGTGIVLARIGEQELLVDSATLRVIDAWVESVRQNRPFSTEDVRVLRVVFPGAWRKILGGIGDPNYFDVRDAYLNQARERMERAGMRMPQALQPATQAQEDAVFQKLMDGTDHLDHEAQIRRIQTLIEKRKWTARRFDWKWINERAATLAYEDDDLVSDLEGNIDPIITYFDLVTSHFDDEQPEGDGLPFAGIERKPLSTTAKVLFTGVGLAVTLKVLEKYGYGKGSA